MQQPMMKYQIGSLVPLVLLMWIEEFVDYYLFNQELDSYGIRPRELDGLWGIPLAPFLHGDFGHLIANTFPLIILGCLILVRSIEEFWIATLMAAIVGGLGTWVLGQPETVHIGASGLVFGYMGYLLLRGYLERSSNGVLVALLVLFFYGGSLVRGVIPTDGGVSWEGHLFGFIGGLLAAHAVSRS